MAVYLGAAVENGMGPEGHRGHRDPDFSEPEAPLPVIASDDGSAVGPCGWAAVHRRGREEADRDDLRAGLVVSQHPASAAQPKPAWNPRVSGNPARIMVSFVSAYGKSKIPARASVL